MPGGAAQNIFSPVVKSAESFIHSVHGAPSVSAAATGARATANAAAAATVNETRNMVTPCRGADSTARIQARGGVSLGETRAQERRQARG